MTRLYLIRHGETLWNIERRAQGIKNIELSQRGIAQGKLLAQRLKKQKIDIIYSSDLSRAYETASIIGKEIDKPVYTLPEIREMNFGDWEGLTMSEIKENYKDIYDSWKNTPYSNHTK